MLPAIDDTLRLHVARSVAEGIHPPMPPAAVARGLVLLLLVSFFLLPPRPAAALTPESPEVKRMIRKGLRFLDRETDGRLGGACLVGMVFYKDGRGLDHPRVQEAIEACQRNIGGGQVNPGIDIYSLGIALIFLCDVGPSSYANEIEALLEELEERQKRNGGWGYEGEEIGDTSMTQYAVLGTWAANRNGYETSLTSVERVTNWLIRTQDPNGGFGYKGADPGEGDYNRQDQSPTHAMSAAGGASTYVLADLLQFTKGLGAGADPDLPEALREVVDGGDDDRGPLTRKVNARRLQQGMNEVDGWIRRQPIRDVTDWEFYYIYALERFHSFRELARGRGAGDLRWYDEGAKFLRKKQGVAGSWGDSETAVNTAFAILFLQRSTMKTIETVGISFGDGTLIGGRGLPRDTSSMRVRSDGKVIAKPIEGTAGDLMDILDRPDHPDFEYLVAYPDEMELSDDPEEYARQLDRMQRILRHGSADARRAVVEIMGQNRRLDHAPMMIFALNDLDPAVRHAAREGLRFTSRKFTGFGLRAEATQEARRAAIGQWKDWYISLRPDAEFLE